MLFDTVDGHFVYDVPSQLSYNTTGRGGRDRTYECGSQSPVPYRLATPLYQHLINQLLISCKLPEYKVFRMIVLAGELGFEPRLTVLETVSLAINRFPYMAGRVGFEPTGGSSPPTVFKTASFNHSDISP